MNDYALSIEGMPKLLSEIEDPLGNFKRKIYPEYFKKYYEANLVTYQAIDSYYESVEEKEAFLKELGTLIAEEAGKELDKIKKKTQREKTLIDYNLCLAVYVLPGILEFKGKASEALAEAVSAAWKERFPTATVTGATFEKINSGFERRFCYITTAVCETFGKPDDCYELTLLRNYRDTYLADQEDGYAIIREYYDLAPTIVKHINRCENSSEIYRQIWTDYLSPCIGMIEQGKNEDCKNLYIKMVRDLEQSYFKVQ